jgi:hypothetical protein
MSVARRCGTLKVSFYHMLESLGNEPPPHAVKCHSHVTEVAEKAVKGKAVDCFTA